MKRGLAAAWSAVCVAALVALVGVRWARYASWSATPALDGLLREAMVVDAQAFLWPWAYGRLVMPSVLLALALVVVGLHRRLLAALVARTDGVWRLRPLPVAIVLGAMVALHALFDVNPTVARVCAASIALAWLTERRALPGPAVVVAWALAVAWGLATAADPSDRLVLVVWFALLAASHRWLARRTRASDLMLVRGVGVMATNVLACVLPLVLPLHGGAHLGDGLAYSFCESPGRGTLYATVPVCDSVQATYEDCRGGRVVEYDLATMRRTAEHAFFSPDFYGRLEMLACLPDEVQVAVQACVYHGRNIKMSALAFPVTAPDRFTPIVAGEGLGMTIAYDDRHDALFYSGEFTNRVVRYDRVTREFRPAPPDAFRHEWFEPVSLDAHDGSVMLNTRSIHPGRSRIYLADWMQGRWAYAADLATLEVVARYDVGGGGALGVSVDPERDRLFVSSMWGLEVFDLTTDRLLVRKRLGLGNRPVIVDAARNRLYVSSMVEGKIRILDRDTLEVIGQVPIGIGSRYPHLSLDGRWLFASSARAHYVWKADELPARR